MNPNPETIDHTTNLVIAVLLGLFFMYLIVKSFMPTDDERRVFAKLLAPDRQEKINAQKKKMQEMVDRHYIVIGSHLTEAGVGQKIISRQDLLSYGLDVSDRQELSPKELKEAEEIYKKIHSSKHGISGSGSRSKSGSKSSPKSSSINNFYDYN